MQATSAVGAPAMRDADKPVRPVVRDDHAVRGERLGRCAAAASRTCIARRSEGCDSFTLFGTTGEGASVGLAERNLVLESVIDTFGGEQGRSSASWRTRRRMQPPRRTRCSTPAGAASCSRRRSISRMSTTRDLYAWFSRGDRGDARAARRLPLSHSFGHPGAAVACADRSREARVPGRGRRRQGQRRRVGSRPSDCSHAHADLHILVGDERLLARAMRHGASGAINGFSNFCARRLLPMVERGDEDPGHERARRPAC